MIVCHAHSAERILGWDDSLHGYPHEVRYVCPRCGAETEFPKPSSKLDSYVASEIRWLFDLETTAKQINHDSAVDFHCVGCSLPVRILFTNFQDGKSLNTWNVSDILEGIPE